MNRRTSLYTVRLLDPTREMIDRVANSLPETMPVQDIGGSSVSFRSPTDDDLAYTVALAACKAITGEWALTTGLGIHRREVTPVG